MALVLYCNIEYILIVTTLPPCRLAAFILSLPLPDPTYKYILNEQQPKNVIRTIIDQGYIEISKYHKTTNNGRLCNFVTSTTTKDKRLKKVKCNISIPVAAIIFIVQNYKIAKLYCNNIQQRKYRKSQDSI